MSTVLLSEVTCEATTEMAIGVKYDGDYEDDGNDLLWIPRSVIEDGELEKGESGSVEIAGWWAKKKGIEE